jgi:hypothetical protein
VCSKNLELDLEVVCKRSIKDGRPPNFQEFWGGDVHCKRKPPKEKTLMFECYSLVPPVERGALIF